MGSGQVTCRREGSTHDVRPNPRTCPARTGSGVDDAAYMPDRLVDRFTSAAPDRRDWRRRRKTGRFPRRLPPAQEMPTLAAEEAEDRAVQQQRDHLTNADELYVSERDRARRWSEFENHLRRNRVDVTSSCRSCGTARDRVLRSSTCSPNIAKTRMPTGFSVFAFFLPDFSTLPK